MLIWTDDLKRLGFRNKGKRYWYCNRGFGLAAGSHISIFLWTVHQQLTRHHACYEVAEFHITFEVIGHNLHFYYHESKCNEWAAAGHTSTAEVARLGFDVQTLRERAGEIARQFVDSVGGVLHADGNLATPENKEPEA